MKSKNNFRNVYRAMMVTFILAFLNIGTAQTYFVSAGTLMGKTSIVNTGNDDERNAVNSTNSMVKSVLDEMDNNPQYWVEYLKNNVEDNALEAPAPAVNSSSILDQMENDPTYWMDYLKNSLEDEITPSVIDSMNNDPAYWLHYLQITVETDNI